MLYTYVYVCIYTYMYIYIYILCVYIHTCHAHVRAGALSGVRSRVAADAVYECLYEGIHTNTKVIIKTLSTKEYYKIIEGLRRRVAADAVYECL